MAEIKFACPHCQQHIQADVDYAGRQISCPKCNGMMTVPAAPQISSRLPASAPAQVQSSSSSECPSCATPLARGAVLCTKCGYNMATRKRMVAGKQVLPGKPEKSGWKTPWHKTAYPYIGIVMAVLAVLYFLGKNNPTASLAFSIVVMTYLIGIHLLVTVSAFQEGIGTGFFTLCLPFFAIYYVFKINNDETLKILYGGALLIRFGTLFI